jgi:hypothetical protein
MKEGNEIKAKKIVEKLYEMERKKGKPGRETCGFMKSHMNPAAKVLPLLS